MDKYTFDASEYANSAIANSMRIKEKLIIEKHFKDIDDMVKKLMKLHPWHEVIISREPISMTTQVGLGKASLWNYIRNKYRLWRHCG